MQVFITIELYCGDMTSAVGKQRGLDLEALVTIPILTHKGSNLGERSTNSHCQYTVLKPKLYLSIFLPLHSRRLSQNASKSGISASPVLIILGSLK